MSSAMHDDPTPGDAWSCDAIESVIVPRARDLGGFSVRRALPSARKQMVGPFIFFDEMGPAEFLLGQGIDIRPHPHIGLATVTFLFDGEMMHRDSLGSAQIIKPGEVAVQAAVDRRAVLLGQHVVRQAYGAGRFHADFIEPVPARTRDLDLQCEVQRHAAHQRIFK